MNEAWNPYIFSRLKGIQETLLALYRTTKETSSTTKGNYREYFINVFLSEVLSPQFRFGTGDITDLSGKKSGQLDIVVEYPLFPSLPILGASSRLYIAEGVAAAIEVKSNIEAQWKQVEKTSQKLQSLKRGYGNYDIGTPRYVPLFAVGYTGWKELKTLKSYLQKGVVDGILVIDKGLFAWNPPLYVGRDSLVQSATGPWALWAFIVCLHQLALSLRQSSFAPALYAMPHIILLEKIYFASISYTNGEVVVFNITDEEGIERDDARLMITQLEEEQLLVKVYETEHLIIVSLTEKGRQLGYQLMQMLY